MKVGDLVRSSNEDAWHFGMHEPLRAGHTRHGLALLLGWKLQKIGLRFSGRK